MSPLHWALGAWALAAELGLLGGLAYAGWHAGRHFGVAAGIVGAVAATGLGIAVWARWFAPTADHRLDLWPRVAGAVALMALTGAAVAASGRPRWGLALAAAGALGMLIAQPALDG